MKIPRPHLPTGITRTQMTSYGLFAVSAVILGSALYMNMNLDVLKDWRLVLPQQAIHTGDTIVVQSLYTKTMDVSGRSVRYIECRQNNGVFVRYPVSEAVSNRASGRAGTGITITVPQTIPNLPATCHVNITIDYEVFAWRHLIESMNSEDFTLLPAVTGEAATEREAQGSNQTQSAPGDPQLDVGSVGSSESSSYPNSAPITSQAQQDSSQAGRENILTPTPEPVPDRNAGPVASAVGGLVDGVSGVLNGVRCAVTGLLSGQC